MNKFTRACEMSFNDWLSTLPDIVPEAEYTKKHEKWKKNLFNKMRGDYYHSYTTRTVTLIVVAAILSTFLLTVFAFPSSREFIIENFDIFSRYKITENNDNSVDDEITVGYIPEGFELVDTVAEHKHILNHYVSKEKDIFFTILKQSSSNIVDFDTEYGDVEKIVINNKEYIFYNDTMNFSCLVWNKNDYIYQIQSSISKDEMLKIAQEVE